jgi:replication-associated recombination protein RarA
MRQLLAAWLVVDPQDLPMNPRLLGKPGVGKTTLAYAAAKRLGRLHPAGQLRSCSDARPRVRSSMS